MAKYGEIPRIPGLEFRSEIPEQNPSRVVYCTVSYSTCCGFQGLFFQNFKFCWDSAGIGTVLKIK